MFIATLFALAGIAFLLKVIRRNDWKMPRPDQPAIAPSPDSTSDFSNSLLTNLEPHRLVADGKARFR